MNDTAPLVFEEKVVTPILSYAHIQKRPDETTREFFARAAIESWDAEFQFLQAVQATIVSSITVPALLNGALVLKLMRAVDDANALVAETMLPQRFHITSPLETMADVKAHGLSPTIDIRHHPPIRPRPEGGQ